MATAVASKTSKYKVSLRGYPLQGLVAEDGAVHARRPKADHYMPLSTFMSSPGNRPLSSGSWYSKRDLLELGYTEEEIEKLGSEKPRQWFVRERPDQDVASQLFLSWVCEAEHEYQAREKFMRQFGVRGVAEESRWKIEPVGSRTPLGLCDSRREAKAKARA